MTIRKQILAVLLALVLSPVFASAEEKKGTVASYDEGSRMVTIKGRDWEQKAKVSSKDVDTLKDLLKEGTKVTVDFDDRGGGDVRVKSLTAR